MTDIYLHGTLAQEYGKAFRFEIAKPKDVLKAIDANKEGFIARILQLQREGFLYDIIVDKQRITSPQQLEIQTVQRIDIVPAIVGSGFIIGAVVSVGSWLFSGGFLANIIIAVGLAALQYLLTPKQDLGLPERQQLSAEANAMKASYVFSTHINTAQQGHPVPLGYGRLKVGSAVIQSSMKSLPTEKSLGDEFKKSYGNASWLEAGSLAQRTRS